MQSQTRTERLRRLCHSIIATHISKWMQEPVQLETPDEYSDDEKHALVRMHHMLSCVDVSSHVYKEALSAYQRRRPLRYVRDQSLWDSCVQTIAEGYTKAITSHSDWSMRVCRVWAMYMALPTPLARRWLWHENVDFQSKESFIRRLTPAQEESLALHFRLAVLDRRPIETLPCYTDGFVNHLWNQLKLPDGHEARLVSKSALAYDFFGWNIGFERYPIRTSDVPAPEQIARQFFSSTHRAVEWIATPQRGDFVVNQESRGMYWYLYRTLRSNHIWNNPDVTLGNWICPGFYLTVIAWVFYLFISPLLLVIGMAHSIESGAPSALLIPGVITPIIWCVHRLCKITINKQGLDGNFWKIAVTTLGTCVGGLVYAFLAVVSYKYVTFWVCALLVVPILAGRIGTKIDLRFWKVSMIGKPALGLLVASIAQDLYSHTMFWETFTTVLGVIGVMLITLAYDGLLALRAHWKMVTIILGCMILLSVAHYLLWRRTNALTSTTNQYVHTMTRFTSETVVHSLQTLKQERQMTLWVSGVYLATCTLVVFYLMTVSMLLGGLGMLYLLLAMTIVSSTLRWERMSLRMPQLQKCFVFGFGTQLARDVSEAFARNSLWWDERGYLRRDLIRSIPRGLEKRLMIAVARHTHSMRGHRRTMRALSWITSNREVQDQLEMSWCDSKKIILMIQTHPWKHTKSALLALKHQEDSSLMAQCRNVALGLPRAIARLLQDGWRMMNVMNQSCPRSPSAQTRPIQ